MKQTSIRTKLFVCFGLVVVAAMAAAAYSLSTISHLRRQVREEIIGSAARLDQSRQITTGIANMRSAMRGVTIFSMLHMPGPFAKARSTFGDTAAEMRNVIQQTEASKAYHGGPGGGQCDSVGIGPVGGELPGVR